MNSFRVFVFCQSKNCVSLIIPWFLWVKRYKERWLPCNNSAHASHLLYISLPSCKWALARAQSLGLIIPRSQCVSGHVVRSPQIRHRSELTEKAWEYALQGVNKVGPNCLLTKWGQVQTFQGNRNLFTYRTRWPISCNAEDLFPFLLFLLVLRTAG